MTPLYLRRSQAPERARGPLTPDQILEALPSGDDCLSLKASDPFVPVEHDLDRNGALRDVLLDAFPSDWAMRYTRVRFVLFAGLVPMLLLVVMDIELLRAARQGAVSALAVDVLSALVVAVDLARRYARHPRVSAAALAATGLQFVQITSARCAHDVHALIPVFGLLALLCAVSMLVLAPSQRAMADHVRKALAMAPPTRLPPRTSHGFFRYIIYAILAAALLPALLWLLRATEMPLAIQLVAFILFALIIPYLGRVFVGRESPVNRNAIASALGIPGSLFRADLRTTLQTVQRISTVALTSLVLSFAMVRGTHSTVETIASVQRCAVGEAGPTPALQRFIDRQREEVSDAKKGKDPSWLLLTVLVVPIAEELVYRGLVQHALRRRLKRRLAIGLAALLFGLAHLVVYRGAVYQPVLLGLSFGLAYERSGILASILVHMLWNLWLSI